MKFAGPRLSIGRIGRIAAMAVACLFALMACGDDGVEFVAGGELSEAERADWVERPFDSSLTGRRAIVVADNEIRIGIMESDEDRAMLAILPMTDTSQARTIRVEQGAVFVEGDWEILVSTVTPSRVGVRWRPAETLE